MVNMMQQIKTVNNQLSHLKRTDLAWLAGLIEGEGSICMSYIPNKHNLKCDLEISNCDIALMNYLNNLFKIGYISSKGKHKHSNYLPAYCYKISNRIKIYALLLRVQPYFNSAKWQHKTEYALKFLESRIKHSYEPYSQIELNWLNKLSISQPYLNKLNLIKRHEIYKCKNCGNILEGELNQKKIKQYCSPECWYTRNKNKTKVNGVKKNGENKE
jgi:hypothetical protein